MELEKQIEAVLFYLAEPVKISFLAKVLEVSMEDTKSALDSLTKALEGRGLAIIENNDEVSLVTNSAFSTIIDKIIKEEREKDLGKAGIETLTIIAYKGPVTKKEIEYIRGVNSQYAIRNLLLRGLIERSVSKTDERMVVYNITSDTIRFLGIKSVEDLPEYKEMSKQLNLPEELEVAEE